MSALKNFERLFKFNPFDFMKKLNAENFAEIKNRIFSTLVSDKVEEQYKIKTDETFFKLLVECYQEAGERFPQNQKVDYGDILLDLSVEPLNPNIPKSKGIIEDFKQIVSDDDLRPAMTGVYFDDGFMVGTDAHVLVKDYADNQFTKKYNKKIIDVGLFVKSKGDVVRVIDERFPEYDRVIPTSGFAHLLKVDLYALYNLAKSAAFYYKLLNSSNVRLRLTIKDENFAVNPIILADLSEYFLKKGSSTAEIKYTTPNRAIVMDFGASMGLIMPVINNNDDKDRNIADTLYYDLEKLQDFMGSGKPTSQGKPTRTRKPKETKPESREEETRSQDFRRYMGKFKDENEYISRREIEEIILKSGETLKTNDFIDGVYRSKKKFGDGGSIGTIHYHKHNPNITFEILEYTNKGVKGLQKNPKSLSRKEKKEGIIVYYSTNEFRDLFEKDIYANGGEFGDGDSIAEGNYKMVLSQAKEIHHHILELQNVLKKEKEIEAWVVGKIETVSADLSTITHYLEGKSEYGDGGEFGGGGAIGFIPIDLEEKIVLLSRWGGTDARGVIGLLNGMVDSGITDEDLVYTLTQKETRLRREKAIEKKIDEIWNKIQPNYNQELKGNMYYSTLKELISRNYIYANILKNFKPYRKYQKFTNGGEFGGGGKTNSFFESAKQRLKKGYSSSKEYAKKKVDDFNKKIALDVIDKTKDKVANKEKIHLKAAEEIISNKYTNGGQFGGGGSVTKKLKRIVRKGTKYGKLAVKKAKPTAKRIVKKAKIGFNALANKVAKAYEGKAVKPKYQKEYGKTYSKAEAKEVGNKVAAKVKRLKGM